MYPYTKPHLKILKRQEFSCRSNLAKFFVLLNRLIINDAFWHHLTLAACYRLAESILKIGFVLAKKNGMWAGFSLAKIFCATQSL